MIPERQNDPTPMSARVEPERRPSLPEGYRWIQPSDAGLPFSSILGYTLGDYVREAAKPGNLIAVRLAGEHVAGVVWFQIHEGSLFVEHLARNKGHSWQGLGTEMLAMVDLAAIELELPIIRLEALYDDRLIEWYRANGYANDGGLVSDDDSIRQPMSKRLR